MSHEQHKWRKETLTVVCLQVRELETEMNDIGKWLVSAGQTLLAETSIGNTTDQAEALLREHEAIELKCRVRASSWSRPALILSPKAGGGGGRG